MKLKHYELIIFILTVLLGYEYLVLNNLIGSPSLLSLFLSKNATAKLNLSPAPGYPISYFLGWAGFVTMLLSNFYIVRKRLGWFSKYGTSTGWLDFHIFCGLMGPIFIIFHSNLKVEGLVSISFWSMMICSSSGIIGRYFYLQVLKKREDINLNSIQLKKNIEANLASAMSQEQLTLLLEETLERSAAKSTLKNPLAVFLYSMKSDVALYFNPPGKNMGLSSEQSLLLKEFGIERRRLLFIDPFNQLLGYWHSFHLPFAVFMYIVAIIHIITALLFGVKH